MLSIILILVASLQLATAHFAIEYPYWRGDSFQDPASQWIRPCGGVNQSLSNTNRTQWPLKGGSVLLDVHHPWAITYVNLGLGGDNTTVFNISLVPGFNQTGNGTFCLPTVTLPTSLGIVNGANASIQVIQIGETGSSLYNCADITFSSDAKALGNTCINSTGVGGVPIISVTSNASKASNTTNTTKASSGAEEGFTSVGQSAMWISVAVVGFFELAWLV